MVFPVSGFPRKNLGVDCVIICIIFGHCLILFLLHKKGKALGLVNCNPLNWCPVVPSFPNSITPPLTLILQMAELSTHCMNEDPTNRPEMREIVQKLSKILMSSIEWEASLGGSSQVFTRLFDGR